MTDKGRIAGVDYGLRRIGVAISDPRQVVASAIPTLQVLGKPQEAAKLLMTALGRYAPVAIVIGLPLRLDGTSSSITDEVRRFAQILEGLAGVPIILWDERLTSAQADRSLREGNIRRKKRAQFVDQVSAAIMLQSYLDSLPSPPAI